PDRKEPPKSRYHVATISGILETDNKKKDTYYLKIEISSFTKGNLDVADGPNVFTEWFIRQWKTNPTAKLVANLSPGPMDQKVSFTIQKWEVPRLDGGALLTYRGKKEGSKAIVTLTFKTNSPKDTIRGSGWLTLFSPEAGDEGGKAIEMKQDWRRLGII